jgi:hypothetical protein
MEDRTNAGGKNWLVMWASKDGMWWVALPEPSWSALSKDGDLRWQTDRFHTKQEAVDFAKQSALCP